MRPAVLTSGLGGLLLLSAATFDAEPLYVPGVAFLLAGLLALLWVLAAGLGVRVARTVPTHTVIEEQPVEVRIRVQAGVLPLGTGVLEESLLPAPQPLPLGQRELTVRIAATFARRGRRVLPASRVIVRDPLGLATRTVCVGSAAELLVLPQLLPVLAAGAGGEGRVLVPRGGRPRIAAEVELDGLRPYRPGASASRIHWSVFARTGELYERRLTADADARPLVVLDPRGAGGPGAESLLDAAVRATASLTVALGRAGGCSLLLPGDRRGIMIDPALAAWPRMHARLALLEDDGRAPSLAGLGGRVGPIFYVLARPGARAPRGLQAGGGPRVLVAPGRQAGRRALFTVAGCTGAAVGDRRQEAAA